MAHVLRWWDSKSQLAPWWFMTCEVFNAAKYSFLLPNSSQTLSQSFWHCNIAIRVETPWNSSVPITLPTSSFITQTSSSRFAPATHRAYINTVITINNMHLALNSNWRDSISSINSIKALCLKRADKCSVQASISLNSNKISLTHKLATNWGVKTGAVENIATCTASMWPSFGNL